MHVYGSGNSSNISIDSIRHFGYFFPHPIECSFFQKKTNKFLWFLLLFSACIFIRHFSNVRILLVKCVNIISDGWKCAKNMNWLHGQCIVATRNSNSVFYELLSTFVQSSNVTTQTAHGIDGCFIRQIWILISKLRSFLFHVLFWFQEETLWLLQIWLQHWYCDGIVSRILLRVDGFSLSWYQCCVALARLYGIFQNLYDFTK